LTSAAVGGCRLRTPAAGPFTRMPTQTRMRWFRSPPMLHGGASRARPCQRTALNDQVPTRSPSRSRGFAASSPDALVCIRNASGATGFADVRAHVADQQRILAADQSTCTVDLVVPAVQPGGPRSRGCQGRPSGARKAGQRGRPASSRVMTRVRSARSRSSSTSPKMCCRNAW
jgi:hypothetical protein